MSNGVVLIGVPLGLAALLVLPSCTRHQIEADTRHQIDVQPIEVKPIHLTVDVNIRIDRQLDEFFDFEKELEPATTRPATTRPATAPTTPAVPELEVDGE